MPTWNAARATTVKPVRTTGETGEALPAETAMARQLLPGIRKVLPLPGPCPQPFRRGRKERSSAAVAISFTAPAVPCCGLRRRDRISATPVTTAGNSNREPIEDTPCAAVRTSRPVPTGCAPSMP